MLKRLDFQKKSLPIIRWIQSYYKRLETFPVKSQVKPNEIIKKLPKSPPKNKESIEKILLDLEKIILPGITHWQHPNFHAYFPANTSIESLYAEMITAAIGAQCMIWETSPAATELEQRMLEWIQQAMSLPKKWSGVLQDTASTATLTAIITAREVKTNFQSNEVGTPNNLRVYCSRQTHSSIEKAVKICGIGKRNLVKVNTNSKQQLLPKKLEEHIKNDLEKGFTPTCIVATIGTTSSLAVDSIQEIVLLAKKYNLWLHVDAAYAGAALLLPEYQWIGKGLKNVDSFVVNAHKWLFTNFDCSLYYVRNKKHLIQTFGILPEYLKTETHGHVHDYKDWGIPLGRRFRALKLWFVIRGFGIKGIQKQLRKHIKLNAFFSEEIQKSSYFKLTQKPFLNVTCFRCENKEMTKENNNKLNRLLLETLNQSGKIYLTHTKIRGYYTLRMVIGQTYVQKKDVKHALKLIFLTYKNITL